MIPWVRAQWGSTTNYKFRRLHRGALPFFAAIVALRVAFSIPSGSLHRSTKQNFLIVILILYNIGALITKMLFIFLYHVRFFHN
jgi:hypothetical protein